MKNTKNKTQFLNLIQSLGMEKRFNRFLNWGQSQNSTHLVNYFFSRKELTALCFTIDLAGADWSVDADILKGCNSGQLWQLCKENFALRKEQIRKLETIQELTV
jgi:hypothetical protein